MHRQRTGAFWSAAAFTVNSQPADSVGLAWRDHSPQASDPTFDWPFARLFEGAKNVAERTLGDVHCSPYGIRTRVSTLRG